MQYSIERKQTIKRLVMPLAPVLIALAGAQVSDYLALAVGENRTILFSIINKFHILLFAVSIGFGVFIVLPASYFAGASLSERLAAAFVVPGIMIGFTVYQGWLVFSGWDLFHWSTQPMLAGIAALSAFNVAIAEMICRLIHKKNKRQISISLIVIYS